MKGNEFDFPRLLSVSPRETDKGRFSTYRHKFTAGSELASPHVGVLLRSNTTSLMITLDITSGGSFPEGQKQEDFGF